MHNMTVPAMQRRRWRRCVERIGLLMPTRRRGHSPQDAEDLTQGFFACLLAKHYLQTPEPQKRSIPALPSGWPSKGFWPMSGIASTDSSEVATRFSIPLDAILAERLYREDAPQSMSADVAERRFVVTTRSHVGLLAGRIRERGKRVGIFLTFSNRASRRSAARFRIPISGERLRPMKAPRASLFTGCGSVSVKSSGRKSRRPSAVNLMSRKNYGTSFRCSLNLTWVVKRGWMPVFRNDVVKRLWVVARWR